MGKTTTIHISQGDGFKYFFVQKGALPIPELQLQLQLPVHFPFHSVFPSHKPVLRIRDILVRIRASD